MRETFLSLYGPGSGHMFYPICLFIGIAILVILFCFTLYVPGADNRQSLLVVLLVSALVLGSIAASMGHQTSEFQKAMEGHYTCYLDGEKTDMTAVDMFRNGYYPVEIIHSQQMVLAETGEAKVVNKYFEKFGKEPEGNIP